MAEAEDKFTSPWGGLALVPLGCVLGGFGVRAMTQPEVVYTDRAGAQRVLRGDYAAMYAWFFVIAGAALIIAGVSVFIRETRRRKATKANAETSAFEGR